MAIVVFFLQGGVKGEEEEDLAILRIAAKSSLFAPFGGPGV